jgi:Uma2 family endonuclease
MSTALKRSITPEEYLANERLANFKSEFYRGEIFAMAGASEQHNLIVMNVGASLHLQLKGRPCRVYPSDLRLRIPRTGLFTYPDLMVICGEPQFEFDRRDVVTNPILLIEVLSDSTEAYDRGAKFEQYRTLDSLKQYMLIAQDRFSVESFTKQENGNWLLSATNDVQQSHKLDSIQCVLSLVDIYDKVEFAVKKSESV